MVSCMFERPHHQRIAKLLHLLDGELLARADPPDPLELLTAAGWQCTGHAVQELCLTYNRVLSLAAPGEPTAQPSSGQSRGGFVTALR